MKTPSFSNGKLPENNNFENGFRRDNSNPDEQIPSAGSDVLYTNSLSGRIVSTKIAISNEDKIRFIYPKEVILCKSYNNSTMFHLTSGEKILISKTLKKTEEYLQGLPQKPKTVFFRTHQSYLVNLHHIIEYIKKDGGYLLLTNKLEAIVAKDKREDLFKQLHLQDFRSI